MPAELAWTTETPAEPGVYLWRAPPFNSPNVLLVDRDDPRSPTLYADTPRFGQRFSHLCGQPVSRWKGQWLGPLPE